MVSRTRLRSILTGLALYALAAMVVGYFGINAYTGKYGLTARHDLEQEIARLTDELQALKAQRVAWERKTNLLRATGIDPDMLDERARAQLNFTHERDLVPLLPGTAR